MLRRKTVIYEPVLTLPKRDQYVLDKYVRRMKAWDEMFYVCCCYIGWDVLLEFIPVVGKVISLGFSLSMYRLACQVDLPKPIRHRMLYHITVDFLLGLIPILGILLDALYRAHSKNTKILRKYLYQRAREKLEQENSTQLTTSATMSANIITSSSSNSMNSTPMDRK